MSKSEPKKQSFEKSMAELEKIVAQVEEGEIPLEECIDKFEQGMKLITHCRSILEQAEKRIETITKEAQASAARPPETTAE
ncbi:MAG: exodeoxyribonuclease VII small subunit [Sedimentisphaerales bacterium]|nr:exodeoxyribonuclease VII small subunit [Sedimentisphaerales bacterium]